MTVQLRVINTVKENNNIPKEPQLKTYHKQTIKNWEKILSCGILTESQITHLRMAFRNEIYGDKIRDLFYRFMPKSGYRLTKEQITKGKEYLIRTSIKKNGTSRLRPRISERYQSHLKDITSFTLIGITTSEVNYNYYVPEYKAYKGSDGLFSYVCDMYINTTSSYEVYDA